MPIKGGKASLETRKKMSLYWKGRKKTFDAIKNLGRFAQPGVMKGVPKPEGFGEKIRQANLGKPFSEERKRHISEATKGRVPWNLGKHHSEETKRKIGLKSKGRTLSPKARKQGGDKRRGANNPSWKGGISLDPKYYTWKGHERKMRRINASGLHTSEEWEKLKKFYGSICLRCKRPERIRKLTEDHVVLLTRGGSDSIDNIQPLCQHCNSWKHTKIIDFRPSNQDL